MENKGNKSSTFILLIFTVITALLCLVSSFSHALSHSVTYSDPVVSTRNIRGTIYDRRGNALALDTSMTGFLFSSSLSIQEATAFISNYTDYSAVEIASLVENGTYFIPLSVSYISTSSEIEKNIEKAGLDEIVSVTTGYYRSSPYTYLTFILGESVNSYTGNGGIEEKYNSYLSAVPTLGERNEKGEDLVLTIDLELEEILLSALGNTDESISAAILNSKGEILAYRGKADDTLFSAITYSHSGDYETVLFERKEYISLGECTGIENYYIHLSSNENGELKLIENALRKNGRI